MVKHAESVVLPLLLPDSPVAIWWPTNAPHDPAGDPLGALAQRRITDAAAVTRGKQQAMHTLCSAYSPGNTDLAWTRLTPWRALLAAALDQYQPQVTSASVTAERISPSADLLVTWLADRLKVKVSRHSSTGPGITEVVLETKQGPIRISRRDGKLATISSPTGPTGRSRSSAWACPRCWPRSCVGSTRTTSTPLWPAVREEAAVVTEVRLAPPSDRGPRRRRRPGDGRRPAS